MLYKLGRKLSLVGSEKPKLIREFDSSKIRKKLCGIFNVAESTVCQIFKCHEDIEDGCSVGKGKKKKKRMKMSEFPAVEKCLHVRLK